ncbi:hypothetical protein J6590_052150 [Homalodisca vitripennis]|nr:hypothetical protein J6590_052150 [Homalodisca vitripennis]
MKDGRGGRRDAISTCRCHVGEENESHLPHRSLGPEINHTLFLTFSPVRDSITSLGGTMFGAGATVCYLPGQATGSPRRLDCPPAHINHRSAVVVVSPGEMSHFTLTGLWCPPLRDPVYNRCTCSVLNLLLYQLSPSFCLIRSWDKIWPTRTVDPRHSGSSTEYSECPLPSQSTMTDGSPLHYRTGPQPSTTGPGICCPLPFTHDK